MQAKIDIESTAVPGYVRYLISFSHGKTPLEKKLVKALTREKGARTYLAGAEPEFGLYLGKRAVEIPGDVAVAGVTAKTHNQKISAGASYTTGSEFYAHLKAQDSSYIYECRCGCKFKHKKTETNHKRKCSLLASLQPLFRRIDASATVREFGDDRKGKGKKDKKLKGKRKVRDAVSFKKTKREKRAKKTKVKVSRRGKRTK